MHHKPESRPVRERIIAADVKKLELRQARRRAGNAQRRRAEREVATGRAPWPL